MKQGATRLRRVPETAAEIAAMPARASADSAAATRAIPVNLMPLISAYRKRGRFMLRIENLPQHARFSAGQNNGDGSWSLALDELDELIYFVPKNVPGGDHTLSIRLVAKEDSEAFTLALIDFPILGMAGTSGTESAGFPKQVDPGPSQDLLHSELQEAQAKLTAREAELNQLRASAERMGVLLQQKLDQAVADAEARWRRDEQSRTAAEKAKLEEQFGQRLTERESRVQAVADIAREQQAAQIRRLAQELGTAQETLAARDGELAASRAALERARGETESEIVQARQSAKTKAADALKAAEAEWQAKAGRALAEMTARRDQAEAQLAKAQAALAAADRGAELQQLQGELESLRRKAETDAATAKAQAAAETANRDAELQQLRGEMESLRQKADADAAAAKSQADVRMAERLKAAEADWQAQSARALAELTARAERAEAGLSTPEDSDHGAEMNQLRADLERQRFQLEMDLLSAKVALEAKAADALKAAEAQWQMEADEALKAVTARAEKAEADLAGARAAAQPNTDRDMALNQLRRELEHQRVKAQEDAAAQRAVAEVKAAEAQAALAGMTARVQLAEAALAKAPSPAEHEIAANQLRRELEHQRIKAQSELTVAKAALESRAADAAAARTEAARLLSEREAEMTQLRAELERNAKTAETEIAVLKTEAERESAEKLKSAQSRWESEKANLLAQMQERTEAAEATLARARRLDASKADDDAYVHSLEREIKTLRATLADREISVVHDQAMQEHVRLGTVRDTPASRWQPLMGPVGEDAEEKSAQEKSRQKLFRDIAIVVAVAAAAVLLFPRLEGMLPDNVRYQIETLGGFMAPAETEAPAPAPQPVAAAQPKADHPTMYVARAVNVRAEPSTSAPIAASLKRGAKVAVLEKRGNWDQVEIAAPATSPAGGQAGSQVGATQQGWVFNSYLTDSDPGTN